RAAVLVDLPGLFEADAVARRLDEGAALQRGWPFQRHGQGHAGVGLDMPLPIDAHQLEADGAGGGIFTALVGSAALLEDGEEGGFEPAVGDVEDEDAAFEAIGAVEL